MNLSIQFKSILSHILFRSGITKKRILNLSENNFLVLMYHRVIPDRHITAYLEDGMYVTPKTFELHLTYLKDNFNVIPVSEIYNHVNNNDRQADGRPICVLTFDDGWFDFYEYAFPLLKKYNMPAIVFLSTAFVDSPDWFWTDRLSYILYQIQKKSQPSSASLSGDKNILDLCFKIENLKGSLTKRIDTAIELLKAYQLSQIEQVLDELLQKYNLTIKRTERAFLRWEEIREIYDSGLVEFGSHTHKHNILDKVDEDELLKELTIPVSILEKNSVTHPDSICFCYPNGNFNSLIAAKVKETGYKMAFTTIHRWENFKFDPYRICRIAIHEDMSHSKAMFANRIAGYI